MATKRSRTILERRRCPWAKTEQYIEYHDKEWGVPVHDDRTLFEFLVLEGAQAGLSWEMILKKRENYREAFDHFDPAIVAKYGQRKRHSLLLNPGIIRNRLKIEAAIQNAKVIDSPRLRLRTNMVKPPCSSVLSGCCRERVFRQQLL